MPGAELAVLVHDRRRKTTVIAATYSAMDISWWNVFAHTAPAGSASVAMPS